MQGIRRIALAAALPALAGCALVGGWMAGTVEEGIPKLRDRLPRTSRVHLANPVNANGYQLHARSRRQVERAFGSALDGLGVAHSSKTNGCDVSLHVVVDSWEYGDAGFAGFGDRDAVEMSVVVMRLDTRRALTRASLFARDLDALARRYVESLFEEGEDDGGGGR